DPVGNARTGRESILDALYGMLGQGVSERHLDVHYRSRNAHLIQFSNHYFYKDRLLLFPSPAVDADDTGLRDSYVPDGRYDASGSQTNRREAEEAVRLVLELARARPWDESIGVVALSRAQADLIEALIDQRRIEEGDVDERLAPH